MTEGRFLSPTMLGLAGGAILVPLNSTMLAVALPSIMTEFTVGPATVASLVTLYLGAVAVALPASGSLGDRFGHQRMFLLGVIGFAVASVIAATAASFAVLALSRVLQAASGALVSTSSAALVRETAPAERRGAAFGLFDMLVSTSAAVGPFIGGVIVGAFDWRTLFFVSVPIALAAAAAVALMARRRPAGAAPARRSLDLLGLALLAALLIAVLAAFGAIASPGLDRVAGLAVLPLLVAFLLYELRSPNPAVDPRLFASRPFAAAVAGVAGATVVLHATFVLVPLLVEGLQRRDPTTAGLVLLGISALGVVAAPIGGRLSDRVGRRRPAVAGMVVCAIGLALLWRIAPTATPLVLGALLGVVGFGMGLSGSPRQAAAFETVGPERAGMAAGTYFTGRYLGGVLGASLAGVVLGSSVTAAGVATGFGLAAIVAVGVVVASFGLPGRRTQEAGTSVAA